MADPVSLLGTIAGVASLAASVSVTLYDVIGVVKNAPKDMSEIAGDLSLLSSILENVREIVQHPGIYKGKLAHDLIRILSKVEELAREIKRKLKNRRGIKQVVWLFRSRTVKELRGKIKAQKSTLNTVLSTLQLAATVRRRYVVRRISDSQAKS
jgi:hypothetical protein